jgi:Mg-chelatase subunit ChlD
MTAWLDISLRLAEPWGLAALLLAVVPLLLARQARRRHRRLRGSGVALQCLALAAVAVAVAQPQLAGREGRRPWLVLRDVSASLRTQTDRPLDAPRDIELRERHFAAGLLPAEASDLAPLDRSATDIAPALQLAAAQANELAGVVILTDGQFTRPWQAAAKNLQATGLDVMLIGLDAPPLDARLSRADLRQTESDAAELSLTLAANGTTRRTLSVYAGADATGPPLVQRELSLTSGSPLTEHIELPAPQRQAAELYRAVLSPADAVPENDRTAAVVPRPAGAIGVLTSPAISSADLQTLLPDPPGPVERLAADGLTAAQLPDLRALLLLPQSAELPTSAQQTLGDYARSGGAVVMLTTGPHASPADLNAPLNQVAALVPNLFERAPLELVLVLDASGSMAQAAASDAGPRVKFDLAANAALALRRHLTPRDRLRVIAFAETGQSIYSSDPTGPDFGLLADALRQVRPAGPTHVAPALQQAAAAPPAGNRQGLVLVLSDLETRAFNIAPLANIFRERGWQLAVIQTGRQSDSPTPSPLERLADRINGMLLYRPDLAGLSELFGSLVRRGRGPGVREAPLDVQTAEGWAMLTALGDSARLVLTEAPAETEVLARADGDPLLGRRRVGLGEVWTLPLASLPAGQADALSQAIAEILRRVPAGNPAWDLRADWEQASLSITLQAQPQTSNAQGRSLVAEVLPLTPQAEARSLELPQMGLGRYQAALPLQVDAAGVVVRDAVTGERLASTSAARPYPSEFARLGANREVLREFAAALGARQVSLDDAPALMLARAGQDERALWPWLLAGGLGAMLLQWGIGGLTLRRRARGQES